MRYRYLFDIFPGVPTNAATDPSWSPGMAITDLDSLAGQRRETGRTFYTVVAIVAGLVVLAGFSRTFYARAAFGTPELSALQFLHGLVMTAWFVMFAVQVRLAATNRLALHRKLGMYGAVIAALVLIVGTVTAIVSAAEGRSPAGAPPPLVFLAIPLGDMLLFALLVSAALYFRKRPEYHKRLMVTATLGMLTAAIARIQIDAFQRAGLPAFFGAMDLILLAFIAYDTWRNRRLHPAYAWGFGLVILSEVTRFAGAGTPQWMAFARWLTT